jgi:hypothetical protein
MLSLDPPFMVISYPPETAAFGGVGFSFEEPYNLQRLNNEITNVVKSIGNSLRTAYEVKTIVSHPQLNLLSTKVTPIEAELDKRSYIIDVRYSKHDAVKMMRNVLGRMIAEKKDNAILVRDNYEGLYIFSKLKDRFDPVSTGELLKSTKRILFETARQNCKILRTDITPYYLEVDVEIEKPKFELST